VVPRGRLSRFCIDLDLVGERSYPARNKNLTSFTEASERTGRMIAVKGNRQTTTSPTTARREGEAPTRHAARERENREWGGEGKG